MAKNYVEQTDMEEAGFKGDDTLYKRNEKEDGKISTMTGENVVQQKYGHRDEELPPQIGDEGYEKQQEQRDGDRTFQNDREMQQNNGQNHGDSNSLKADRERQNYGDGTFLKADRERQRGRDSTTMNGDPELQQQNGQRCGDSTSENDDKKLQQKDGDLDSEIQDEHYYQADHQRDPPGTQL